VRIALVSSGSRGPASYTLNLANALRTQGHETLLVSTCPWQKERIEGLYEPASRLAFGLVPLVYRPRDVARVVEDFRPDVIHHQWPCGTFDLRFDRLLATGIPAVATVHVSVDSRDYIWDWLFRWHFGRFLRFVDSLAALISISAFVRAQVERRARLSGVLHRVVYAGLDETIFAPARREETGELRLLFVGEVMPEKGIDCLIRAAEAARRSRPLTLTIVGRGPMERLLRSRTRGLDWVRWAGFLGSQRDIAAHYARADLTVLPTRWDEAFSLVPVESMACGTPVLSTRRGGTPEIVIPGDTGYLIEDGSAEEICSALLSVKREELCAMRQRCRRRVLAGHTFARWTEAHESIYAAAVDHGGRIV
jgi:glycosyltransferase involved in cell wall biosynthesis